MLQTDYALKSLLKSTLKFSLLVIAVLYWPEAKSYELRELVQLFFHEAESTPLVFSEIIEQAKSVALYSNIILYA